MSESAPAGAMSDAVRWACALVLGGIGIFGVSLSLHSEDPRQSTHEGNAPAGLTRSLVSERVEYQTGQQEPSPTDAPIDAPTGKGAPVADAESPSAPTRDDAPGIQKLISINSASVAELELLPRIGPVMAQRIIEDRNANGPFRDIADLQRVRGIGPKTAEKLEPLISFE